MAPAPSQCILYSSDAGSDTGQVSDDWAIGCVVR